MKEEKTTVGFYIPKKPQTKGGYAMKILMLSSRMCIGGAESHIYTLCRELRELGHEVKVASSAGAYLPMLCEIGAEHVTLPLDRKDPRSLFVSARGIMRLVAEFRPDAVHSHSRIPSFICERLLCLPCPLVTTAHMPFRTSALLRAASAWGDETIAVSEDVRQYLCREYKLHPSTVRVIKNGVRIPGGTDHTSAQSIRTETREQLSISAQEFVICCASRSSESRSAVPMYLCEHAPELLRKGERLLVCISGAVDRERDMSCVITEKAKRANALLGREAVSVIVGQSNIDGYIAAADVFVGVSRAAMEAMALGVPVIIAGNEGVAGIIDKSNAQLLSEANLTGRGAPGSLSDIGQFIEALRDEQAKELAGRFCMEYAREHFCSRRAAEQTLDVYRRACLSEVLLIGNYGSGNLGDDAALDILDKRLGHSVRTVAVCRRRELCRSHSVLRTDIKSIKKHAKRAVGVVLGTGNILQDRTSLRSILYYSTVLKLAKKHNNNLIIFANGIGPLEHRISKKLTADAFSAACHASLRDADSYAAAQSVCKDIKNLRLRADILLLCGADVQWWEEACTNMPKRFFVVCPRGGADRSETDALLSLTEKYAACGIRAVVVAMDSEKDTPACRRLAQRGYPLIENITAPRLLALVSHAEFCVSGRLHGAVLSALAQTPFVGIDSDGRIGAFCRYSRCGTCLVSGQFDEIALADALRAECVPQRVMEYRDKLRPLCELARTDARELEELLLSFASLGK